MDVVAGVAQDTVTDGDGLVHVLDGERTVCGQSAAGWSRTLTQLQLMGLVVFCPACKT